MALDTRPAVLCSVIVAMSVSGAAAFIDNPSTKSHRWTMSRHSSACGRQRLCVDKIASARTKAVSTMASAAEAEVQDRRPAPTNLVICGGGIQSAAIAYYLSLRGVQTTIVERCKVLYAASCVLAM
jgi:hypothetical protein